MTRDLDALQDIQTVYREAFLAELGGFLTHAAAEWPTTSCWTVRSLKKLIPIVQGNLATRGPKNHPPIKRMIEWLVKIKLARLLPVEGDAIYRLDLGGSEAGEVDPYELLMAAQPRGVICFMGAVCFHSLTTQMPAQYHVAELKKPRHAAVPNTDEAKSATPGKSEGTTERKLGRLMFSYGGIPYYDVSRVDRLVPGVQVRNYGPRTRIRITTVEQTLLDCLYKPYYSGGPEVVFEAWRDAAETGRIDEDKLADHLDRMKYPATLRRTGAMLALIGHVPGTVLHRTLRIGREAIDRGSPHAEISLLPGVDYRNLDGEWLVRVP